MKTRKIKWPSRNGLSRDQQAANKAEWLVQATLGICAMEPDWYGVPPHVRAQMVEQTKQELLTGSEQRLWAQYA